jgi:hypothetical protein
MQHQGKSVQDLQNHEEGMKYWQDSMKYWRSWGSWFSWGSPVGLGLFFMAVCFCIWLLGLTFGWGN